MFTVIIFHDVNIFIFSVVGNWAVCRPSICSFSTPETSSVACSATVDMDLINISPSSGMGSGEGHRASLPVPVSSSGRASATRMTSPVLASCGTRQAAAPGGQQHVGTFPWCSAGGFRVSSEMPPHACGQIPLASQRVDFH